MGIRLFHIITAGSVQRKEVRWMKKVLSKEVLEKEAALWKGLKKAAADNPGKACRK